MSKKTKNRALRRRAFRDQLQRIEASQGQPVGGAFAITAGLTIQAGQDADGEQPRKLPTISADAYNGGPMMVKGYQLPVVVDVAGVSGFGRSLPVLRAHDENRIVGHGTATASGEGAIKLSGQVSAENDHAAEVTRLAANGFPWQASIGLNPTKIERLAKGQTAQVNGQQISGPAYVVRAGKLYEVSIVPLGADDTTAANVAAAMGQSDDSGQEDEAAGGANVSGTQQNGGDNGQRQGAVQTGAGGSTGISSGSLAQLKAEQQRRDKLETVAVEAAKRGADIAKVEEFLSDAIQAGSSAQELELRYLRELHRPGPLPGHAPEHDTASEGRLLEAAIAIQCGAFEKLENHYDERTLQQAEDRFGGVGLVDILKISAKRNGYSSVSSQFSRDLLQAAFAPVKARGSSTYDLSGVLSNVANKAIREGFMAVDQSWREIAATARARDFKQMTHYALTGDFKFEKVGPSGELKHATMGEESYTNQVDTYGKIFAISRQDFRNDDLSAFSRVRRLLGRGAALQFNTIFWTEFLDDISTFWTAGRANYFDGAATLLQSSSLQTAEQMLAEQTDPDGNLMGAMGKLLLVPPAINVTARELYESTNINTGGSSSTNKVPNRNVFVGRYKPVMSAYIGASGVTNGSDTHWFLLTDPMDVPVIEAAFLDGKQMPTVEAADADFDILGVQMRGYWDFGVNKQEYRGGVRSKGAA